MDNDGVYEERSSSDKLVFYYEYPSETSALINIEQSIPAPNLPHNRLGSTPCISTKPSNKHVLQHAF